MNELLQKHGCANVFTVPEGLKELMSDITREVLRAQPEKIFDFIANYLSVLLITREHGVMAVNILDDLCDCRPTVAEHLAHLGVDRNEAEMMAQIINDEICALEPVEGKEKLRECTIVKKILARITLDEEMSAAVCQVIRNSYRDYWYRKKLLEKDMKMHPNEPWEIAAEHTLEIYKRTKPSFEELSRATVKIQAAYRGYHVRRSILRKLKVKTKKSAPKVELPGPPLDIAGSREIDLGRVLDIKPREDDVSGMFEKEAEKYLGLKYDPLKTITHVENGDLETDAGSKTVSQKRMKFSSFVETSDATERASDKSAVGVIGKSTIGVADKSSIGVTGKSSVGIADKSSVGVSGKSTVGIADKSSVGIADKSSIGVDDKSSIGVTGKSSVVVADESSIGVTKSEVQSRAAIGDLSQASKMKQHKSTTRQASVPIISFDEKPEVFTVEDAEMPEEAAGQEAAQEIPEEPLTPASDEGYDVQEVPEDISGADDTDHGEDTVPTASTANSTDVEDIVTDVGEED